MHQDAGDLQHVPGQAPHETLIGHCPELLLALADSMDWKRLVERFGHGPVQASTTLGRIDVMLARRLIARGYLNTYLVSLFLAPLSPGDLDRLTGVEERIDKIVVAQPSSR
jgi:hypothetical protein